MNKKIILTIFLLALLVLTSCVGGRVRPGTQTTNYFSGQEGLAIRFLDQAPPDETYEGRTFTAELEVQNKGGFSLVDPYVALFDISYDSSKVTAEALTADSRNVWEIMLEGNSHPSIILPSIQGKNQDWPTGETRFLPLMSFEAKEIPGNFQTAKTMFVARTCYPYETNFATEICVDTDVDGISERDEVCTLENKKFSRGQGAPIGVVGIESSVVPRGVYIQPQFTIHLQHFGKGTFSYRDITSDSYDVSQCQEIEREDLNKVSVEAILGEDDLDCLPSEVYFRDGEAKIQCRLTQDKILGVSSNYQTSLVVKAAYIYTETFQEETKILKSQGAIFDDDIDEENGESPCFNWQAKENGTCIDLCEYKAKHDRNYIEFNKIKHSMNQDFADGIPDDYLWDHMSCTYDLVTCKDNPDLCLQQSDLCSPGNFCGLPTCLLSNSRPQVSERLTIGSEFRFHCTDSDDLTNFKGTCGCTLQSQYKFEENRRDCDNETNYIPIDGIKDIRGVKYTIDLTDGLNDEDEPFLCVKVTDALGKELMYPLRHPYNNP